MKVDENYEDWKPGDVVRWCDEPDSRLVLTEKVDDYGRAFWCEDGEHYLTRASNLERVYELQTEKEKN